MSRWFNIDIKKFATLLIPTELRKDTYVIFIKSCMEPLRQLYNSFLFYRNRNVTLLQHSPSKASVEALMRKMFGVGIYITQGNVERAVYLSDTDPVYLSDIDPVYLYPSGIYFEKEVIYLSDIDPDYLSNLNPIYIDSYKTAYDFILNVPTSLWNIYSNDIDNYMRLLTLPGMVYNINIY